MSDVLSFSQAQPKQFYAYRMDDLYSVEISNGSYSQSRRMQILKILEKKPSWKGAYVLTEIFPARNLMHAKKLGFEKLFVTLSPKARHRFYIENLLNV